MSHLAKDDRATVPLLLVMVAGGITVSLAETYWWLGPTISLAAFIAVVWFNGGRHWLRQSKMKHPCRVDLVGPGDKMVKELRAAPNSEVSIQLRIWPLLGYQHHELIFGFIGDPLTKPLTIKTRNEFIKIGQGREQSPDTNENHIIDSNDNYHIRQDRHVSPPNNYTYGFVVKTREPGTYPIRFELITDGGESCPRNSLFLTVAND